MREKNQLHKSRMTFPLKLKTVYSEFVVASYKVKNFLPDIKGTGTRDLIWLKVVSLNRSWLVGLTENL